MECLRVKDNCVDEELIKNTEADFKNQISKSVIGERKGFFEKDTTGAKPLGEAFDEIRKWVAETYKG